MNHLNVKTQKNELLIFTSIKLKNFLNWTILYSSASNSTLQCRSHTEFIKEIRNKTGFWLSRLILFFRELDVFSVLTVAYNLCIYVSLDFLISCWILPFILLAIYFIAGSSSWTSLNSWVSFNRCLLTSSFISFSTNSKKNLLLLTFNWIPSSTHPESPASDTPPTCWIF